MRLKKSLNFLKDTDQLGVRIGWECPPGFDSFDDLLGQLKHPPQIPVHDQLVQTFQPNPESVVRFCHGFSWTRNAKISNSIIISVRHILWACVIWHGRHASWACVTWKYVTYVMGMGVMGVMACVTWTCDVCHGHEAQDNLHIRLWTRWSLLVRFQFREIQTILNPDIIASCTIQRIFWPVACLLDILLFFYFKL